ncbi:MAG: hypothetical protein GY854_31740 [Deltaproteobacteria bacterium]|nr:hypothetical protein [Deltaproteobacteria bacterium]
MYIEWEPVGPQEDWQRENCEDRAAQYEAEYGGKGNCVPYEQVSGNPEEPNGIDDNCDGVYMADESCNGIDDDNDGQIDEDEGACLQRVLFVPRCWNDNGQTEEEQRAELTAAVDRWKRYFVEKSNLSSCALNDHRQEKIWFEAATMDAIDVAEYIDGKPDCPVRRDLCQKETDNGTVTTKEVATVAALRGIYETGKYDPANWDIIAFVTNPASASSVGGYSKSGGLISLSTGGITPLFGGEFGTYTHEWGHNFLFLDEEYRIDTNWDGSLSQENPLTAETGCDSGHLGASSSQSDYFDYLGPCCAPFPDGCDTQHPDDDDYCKTLDGADIGYRCKGNYALDWSSWDWGDSAPPPVYGDEGRCIMSSAQADGWDTGNETSGLGNSRGWCKKCWEQWDAGGLKCSQTYGGKQRIVEAAGHFECDEDEEKLILTSYSVKEGRVSSVNINSDVLVELTDSTSVIGSFSPDCHAHYHDPTADEFNGGVWVRVPVAGTVDEDAVITFTTYVQGIPVAQVTGNGYPAVAVASDTTAECSSPLGATVTLDGSGSYDPEDDDLYFTWESNNVTLSDAHTEYATGLFPLGTETVSLTVKDGTGAGETISIEVTVQDTTPPVIDTSTITIATCLASGAVAEVLHSVTDACTQDATIQVDGYIKSMNGVDVGLIPITDPNLILPIGDTVIRWDAVDENGNQSSAEQVFTVEFEPPPERDALFISNGYYPQEQALRDHLAIDNDYDIDTFKDYQINGTTDLSGYELIILTGFAPNVSYAGINNIASSGVPVLIVEYWDFIYSYKLGLTDDDYGWFGNNLLEVLEVNHPITYFFDADFQAYTPSYYAFGVGDWNTSPGIVPIIGGPTWGQTTVISDDTRKIVATGLHQVTRYNAHSWNLFDRCVTYLTCQD